MLAFDRLRDDRIESRELREPISSLLAQFPDQLPVTVGRVAASRRVLLEVDTRNADGHFVAPIGVRLPGDTFFGDLLHDLRRDLDRDLLARGTVAGADGSGV